VAPAQQAAPLPPLPPVPPPAWRPSDPDFRPAPLPPLPGETKTGPIKKLNYHKPRTPPLPGGPGEVVQVAAMQAIRPAITSPISDQMDYLTQLVPPPFDRMFRLMNEDALREQIRQEGREATPKQAAVFPEERPLTDQPYVPRTFAAQVALAEPAYVNYKRLFFEDINSERYGWELGFAQPFVSTGIFFADLALLPYHFASRPFDCVESSAGYCLPDSPVPYLLYPPELSTTGALGEAAAILGLIAIFP
jgi:hypothetical protein